MTAPRPHLLELCRRRRALFRKVSARGGLGVLGPSEVVASSGLASRSTREPWISPNDPATRCPPRLSRPGLSRRRCRCLSTPGRQPSRFNGRPPFVLHEPRCGSARSGSTRAHRRRGALSGKHLTHIDRIGAYAAREAAVRAVQGGAQECQVRLAWAPNLTLPLDVAWEMKGRGPRLGPAWFDHPTMPERYPTDLDYAVLAAGGHFFDAGLAWNGLRPTNYVSASPPASCSRNGGWRRHAGERLVPGRFRSPSGGRRGSRVESSQWRKRRAGACEAC